LICGEITARRRNHGFGAAFRNYSVFPGNQRSSGPCGR
jgi:hypothetical protein